jgi:cardiolipin synthase A/B
MPDLSRPAAGAGAASQAHRFTWHGTGHSLLEGMLALIGTARESVRLEIYTFADTAIGRIFRDALTAAAQRGVIVRLLVDAVGSMGLGQDFFAGLEAAGGEFRWFNRLNLSSFSFRDHRKLLVVDDAASVGGCNIATEYHGDGVTEGWRDGGVVVRGPVVAALAAEFDRQWGRALVTPWRLPAAARGGSERRGEADQVTALFVRPGFGGNPLREALRADLPRAGDIAITAAYFLPSHRLRRLLTNAARRGAKVRLLLAGRSDVRLMQLASRSLYRGLIRAGVAVYEYQPQILHAKLMVLDEIVYVGSANLDPRSLRINFEVMLRIRDPALAAVARGRFEDDVAQHSILVTLESLTRGRGWWERLKERLAYWLLARVDAELAVRTLRAWHQRRSSRR